MTIATLTDTTDAQAAESHWAVETHGLTKRFGENVAVNGVELLVPRGCAFGYLGPNGAGKTTLIRVLLGLTHADAGSMSLLGYSVPRHRDLALARVGAIVDEPRFHGHLTGRQNLQVLAAARGPAARDRIEASLDRVGILHRADDRVSKYSMGMRQRLGVAACLIGDPQLLVLDEPMNGLDPAGMQDMRDMILSLVAEGRTVVLSSHLLDEVERTCDAVAIVDRGNVIRQGPISELLSGSSLVLQVDCSEPDRARSILQNANVGADVDANEVGLGITLPAGTGRDVVAEINRVLVEGRISVYRLQEIQASLESWFLQVTSRLGAPGMTAVSRVSAPLPTPESSTVGGRDRRGFFVPTVGMITTRFMELRKRRGLMVALILVNIGIPVIFLGVRLVLHASAPKSYGPAGGYNIYTGLTAGVLYIFGFIMAATLGCTAGSIDLTEGMFRHLVVTGRSRLALYLARIPAGLAIIVPLVAVGFTVVCAVCVFAAPTRINYDGASVPAHLSLSGFESWAGNHPDVALCDLPYDQPLTVSVFCPGSGQIVNGPGPSGPNVQNVPSSPSDIKAQAIQVAQEDYPGYKALFLYPSVSLMIETGLWIELEVTVGFIVGLGLSSLLGQRTVPVILMIVLEIVLTPILSRAHLPHLANLQRSVVGLATAHLAPGGLPVLGGGGGGPGGGHGSPELLPESTTVAVCVILAWLVGWTILGAWRMVNRDA